ncbi:ABC transporter permease [Paenalkalicoccus suaedae]|uniref:ABC transporter permease n=1 Tax=Paenalkalicoccus suaedae TaxID=2592382 RepID=A0A859FCV3_9BACI|nr:ABC transporter permease [Paenalkalicoccus suaedae]QKS70085.1 ABC transporter permease [Paenalkalicoccus suaedae]
MRNSLKVAKWELKRNLKNKSFLISLFLTPALFAVFFFVGFLFSSGDSMPGDPFDQEITLYIQDDVGIEEELSEQLSDDPSLTYEFGTYEEESIRGEELSVFLPITEEGVAQGSITYYATPDVSNFSFLQPVEQVMKQEQLEQFDLATEEIEIAASPIAFEGVPVEEEIAEGEEAAEFDIFTRLIPGGFAALILFSVIITGMMIFQSASQEKKEKVAEMVLSSVTPTELMQGKIIGYFGLGMVQVSVWFTIILPLLTLRTDIPIFSYLFVPQTIVLVLIAILGYLMFASIYVAIGATIEDTTASSNFQGLLFIIPWIPFMLAGPILTNPSGTIAQVATFIPLTAPGVLLFRLSFLEEWPWIEIIGAIAVLAVAIVLFMKLAGKIFKTGILLYGKNASVKEILKWLRY